LTNADAIVEKRIFMPAFIGDWTTYKPSPKKHPPQKSAGMAAKTLSEKIIEELLLFHHQFFENFFEKLAANIDANITLDTVGIRIMDQATVLNQDNHYLCKFASSGIEQIDCILSKKAARFIAHRLCGGITAPQPTDPSDLELSLLPVVTDVFFTELAAHWRHIFLPNPEDQTTTYGYYQRHPQQHESETVIELQATFRLFNQRDLSCTLLYSLETIETLRYYYNQLNDTIVETVSLTPKTISKTHVGVKSIIGKTELTLNDIENLEVGDVILMDNQSLSDPIDVTIDDTITFTGYPVQLPQNELGVQLIALTQYHAYVQSKNKPHQVAPINGPASPHTPDDTHSNHWDAAIPSSASDMPEASPSMYPTKAPHNNMPLDAESPIASDASTDDFLWDDLDDDA
jgi:flagellar motor switch protein FliM